MRVREGSEGTGNSDPELLVEVDRVVTESLGVFLSLVRWTELEMLIGLGTSLVVPERAAGMGGKMGGRK